MPTLKDDVNKLIKTLALFNKACVNYAAVRGIAKDTSQLVASIKHYTIALKNQLEKIAETNPQIYDKLSTHIANNKEKYPQCDVLLKGNGITKWKNEFLEKKSPDREFFNLLRQETPTQSQIARASAEADNGWHNNDKERFGRRTRETLKEAYNHPDGDLFALLKATMPEKSEAGKLIEKLTREVNNEKSLKERSVRVRLPDEGSKGR